MALVLPPTIGFGLGDTNLTAAARTGTTITASATANTMGAWIRLFDTTAPAYGFYIEAREVATAATNTSMLANVGITDAGAVTNPEILVRYLNFDAAAVNSTSGTGARRYFCPVYIPSGVGFSVQCQSAIVSDTVVVKAFLIQHPLYKFHSGKSHTYGAVTGSSRGTLVASGNGAYGAYTELLNESDGSGLSRPHRFWSIGIDQGGDTTITSTSILVKLGIGPNSGAVTDFAVFSAVTGSSEFIDNGWPPIVYAPQAVDATNLKIWAAYAGDSTESRGVVAYGFD